MGTKLASRLSHPRTRGLWFLLSMLVMATLLPLLVAGGFTVWLAAEKYRATSSQRLLDTSLTLAAAVDENIEQNVTALRLLEAASPVELDSNQATALWHRYARGEPSSRVIFDRTTTPHDNILPSGLTEAARTTGSAQISNLFTANNDSAPMVAIALPTVTSKKTGDSIVLMQKSSDLIKLIQPHPDDHTSELLIAVTDSNGRLAARSRSPENYLGKQVPDWSTLQAQGTHHGLFKARTTEGGQVMFAFHMLNRAPGWVLVVGEPIELFDARWKEPIRNIAIGGLIAAAIALIAARLIASRILLPVQALAKRGRSVTDDAPNAPYPPRSSIREFEALRRSLANAESALRQRADAARQLAATLTLSEQRYRTLAEAGALVFWRCFAQGELYSITGWRELTGQEDEFAAGQGWREKIHPDDLVEVDLAWAKISQEIQPFDVEFRVRGVSGQWRWVRARGAKIRPDLSSNPEGNEWVGVLEDIDARRQAQARLAYLAQHDTLTGLANRALLQERLNQALDRSRSGMKGALLCLDLDRFKEINDTLGHPLGDDLLRAVTKRLLDSVRPQDLAARLGGDEFAILQDTANQPADASVLATRLIEVVKAPYQIRGHHVVIGVSIGIVLLDGTSFNSERLMQNADLALYHAKASGRGQFSFFESKMDTRVQHRRQLELDLRQAVVNREFSLFYQPLVDLRSLSLNGFEALLRWQHPKRGLLEPQEFLSLAEEVGLMVPLGKWVLEQACREAMQWPRQLKVAINLAPSQLIQPDLYETVNGTLQTIGFPANRLQLETSETALIENIEFASPSLMKLKHAGVAIAMDDYGTGYSSLSYLRAFPFDKIKIDKSFVQALDYNAAEGSAVINAIAQLCAKLGISTTIEGVETQTQLEMVRNEGCDEGQGFLFGRAVPAQALPEMIAKLNISASSN